MNEDRREPTKLQAALKTILFLMAIIQCGFVYWAKWITAEVLDSKPERAAMVSDISHIKEDVSYLRGQADNSKRRDR